MKNKINNYRQSKPEMVLVPKLHFGTGKQDDIQYDYVLYQNEPNPFRSNTTIAFEIPTTGNVIFTVFDNTGKILLSKEQVFRKGFNEINLDRSHIPSSGVLLYKIEYNEVTLTKKMIIID